MRLHFFQIVLLALLCVAPAAAQVKGETFITKDSLPYGFADQYWRFLPSDIPNGADSSLDDSKWLLTRPRLRPFSDSTAAKQFKGVCWLRLHLFIDSPWTSRTMALTLRSAGADEVYLDGQLVVQFGYISTKDSTEYLNPKEQPITLPTISPGRHVIAVRHAIWDHKQIAERFGHNEYGISMSMLTAHDAIMSYQNQQASVLFIFLLLFGIFITLSLVHFVLYLYYRAERANALFSLFAFCLALQVFLPVILKISDDTRFMLWVAQLTSCMVGIVGMSLCYLLTRLFSSRHWHFYIVVVVCLAYEFCLFFWRDELPATLIAMLIVVPLDALYILLSATIRRQPGARIIGGGLLLLILLLLTVIIMVLIQGDVTVNESTLFGQVFLIVLLLAVLSIPISMSMYLAWRFARLNRNLKQQLVQVEALSERNREQEAEKQRLLENRKQELEAEVAERTASLREEKQKSDELLLNILPAEVAAELKATGRTEARHYDNVSVLFTDFVDFTQYAEHLSPSQLVAEIDACFQAFDQIIEKHGLEKIKTVGDAYIAVSGLPAQNPRHAQAVVAAALEIRDFMMQLRRDNPAAFQIRLGVHSGSVVAGIVGVKKFAYDIWGDTVNTAARMEQHSEPDKVNVSASTYELVKGEFQCIYRGALEAKHKGKLSMYFVEQKIDQP